MAVPAGEGMPMTIQANATYAAKGCQDLYQTELQNLAASPGKSGIFQEVGQLLYLCVSGQVWYLSKESEETSRRVQDALEKAPSDEIRKSIARELKGHVVEASIFDKDWPKVCGNANYVIQKIIQTLDPKSISIFIIKEIRTHIVRIAMDKKGCRVIQRLIEYCSSQDVAEIVDELFQVDIVELCKHSNAGFVIQHILDYGSADMIKNITQCLTKNLYDISQTTFGCAVLGRALDNNTPPELEGIKYSHAHMKINLANEILKLGNTELYPGPAEQNPLVKMAMRRHGDDTVVNAFNVDGVQHALSEIAFALLLSLQDQPKHKRSSSMLTYLRLVQAQGHQQAQLAWAKKGARPVNKCKGYKGPVHFKYAVEGSRAWPQVDFCTFMLQQYAPDMIHQLQVPQFGLKHHVTEEGADFIVWVADGTKLQSTERFIHSPYFAVVSGNKRIMFHLIIRPVMKKEDEGRESFKEAKGKARIELKCQGFHEGFEQACQEEVQDEREPNWRLEQEEMALKKLEAELEPMTKGLLRKRLVALGYAADGQELEKADDADDTKAAFIEMIKQAEETKRADEYAKGEVELGQRKKNKGGEACGLPHMTYRLSVGNGSYFLDAREHTHNFGESVVSSLPDYAWELNEALDDTKTSIVVRLEIQPRAQDEDDFESMTSSPSGSPNCLTDAQYRSQVALQSQSSSTRASTAADAYGILSITPSQASDPYSDAYHAIKQLKTPTILAPDEMPAPRLATVDPNQMSRSGPRGLSRQGDDDNDSEAEPGEDADALEPQYISNDKLQNRI